VTVALDLLLVAAFHPEVAGLRATLGDSLQGRVGGLSVAAKVIGIGLPAAAVGLASRLEALRPRGVVMLGTCGVYAGVPIAIRGVAIARSVRLVEPTAIEQRAAFPDPMSLVHATHPSMSGALSATGAHLADVANTLAITTDDALAARVARETTCSVEHLEAFGAASACAAFGIPFTAALGVANVVGSRARDEWRTNHRAAADAAIAVALAWIHAGAPGLAAR
jgi:nucleoside phosphorylase